jgi:hypothetical protein
MEWEPVIASVREQLESLAGTGPPSEGGILA